MNTVNSNNSNNSNNSKEAMDSVATDYNILAVYDTFKNIHQDIEESRWYIHKIDTMPISEDTLVQVQLVNGMRSNWCKAREFMWKRKGSVSDVYNYRVGYIDKEPVQAQEPVQLDIFATDPSMSVHNTSTANESENRKILNAWYEENKVEVPAPVDLDEQRAATDPEAIQVLLNYISYVTSNLDSCSNYDMKVAVIYIDAIKEIIRINAVYNK